MADFEIAMKSLRDGNKLRRERWNEEEYIFLDGNRIKDKKGDRVNFSHMSTLTSKDWELYKEKKYYIYICKKCNKQLPKGLMGIECPFCNTWTYHHECQKEVKII